MRTVRADSRKLTHELAEISMTDDGDGKEETKKPLQETVIPRQRN